MSLESTAGTVSVPNNALIGMPDMSDPNFPLTADTDMSDLPRTLRREHEARARAAQSGLDAQAGAYAPAAAADTSYAAPAATDTYPAAVRRFEVPFFHLAGFFMKAVVAAIPALLLLTALLWGFGQILKIAFPELLQMQIVVSFPKT